MTTEKLERSPAEIEAHIQETRAALDRKLTALEHRLSPREQFARVRARVGNVDRDSVVGWAAIGAVATGAALALTGWRRYHANGKGVDDDDLADVVLLDCADLPPAL